MRRRKLVAIKTIYDPQNLFRLNHNIPPSTFQRGEEERQAMSTGLV